MSKKRKSPLVAKGYITIEGKRVKCSDFPCFAEVLDAKNATLKHSKCLRDLKDRISHLETVEKSGGAAIMARIDTFEATMKSYHMVKANGGPERLMKDVVLELWQVTGKIRKKEQFSKALSAYWDSHPRMKAVLNSRIGVTALTVAVIWVFLSLLASFGVEMDPWFIIKAVLGIKP